MLISTPVSVISSVAFRFNVIKYVQSEVNLKNILRIMNFGK